MKQYLSASIAPLLLLLILNNVASAQSLQETFDWMTSTLKPSEGNNWYIHHPNQRPYPKDWEEKEIDPFHLERIELFSHNACEITLKVRVVDSDMGFLLGRQIYETDTDTFDLSAIDPMTIKITNACVPVDTPSGKLKPWNCEDEIGLQIEFRTRNAKPAIHHEVVASSGYSPYDLWQEIHNPKMSKRQFCKDFPGNKAYCAEAEHKEQPQEITKDTMAFHSPEYTQRFLKAFHHAVELCRGKPSTF